MAEEDDQFAKDREEERLRLEKEREIAFAKYSRYLDNSPARLKQNDETAEIWNNLINLIINYKNNFREQLWWHRYLYEPKRPNCLNTKEIYTFISLWDKQMKSLKAVDKQVGIALKLIEDIYYTEYLFNELAMDVKQVWCKQINTIENLIEEIICLSTFKVLKFASNILDIKTGNLQYQNVQENITLCLWWNVSKNPKYKSFEFNLGNVNFELPRPMVGLECAIQFRHCKFDNFSHYCHSFMTKTTPFCEPPEVFENPMLKPLVFESDLIVESTVVVESAPTLSQIPIEEEEEEEEERQPSIKIVYPDREPAPCPLVAVGIADTCEMSLNIETSEEGLELIPGEINLREMMILGGVWYVNVLAVPPQPIKIEKWRLIEDVPNVLKQFSYEFNYIPPRSSITFAEDDPEAEIEAEKQRVELEKLIAVEIKLDMEKIVWMDTQRAPILVRWDDKHQCWTMMDIYEVKYIEEITTILCRLGIFAPIAVAQHKFLALPYQSWLLQPLDKNSVKLMIQTAVVSVELHIVDDMCALMQAVYNDQNCLEHIYNEFLPPKILLRKMRSFGLNLFPEHDSYKYVEPAVKLKDWNLEGNVYKNFAMCCTGFELGSSRWNIMVGSRNVIFKLREQITTKIKGPQYLVMSNLQDTYILQIVEQSQEFSDNPLPDQEYHVDLYHLAMIAGSTEAKELVKAIPLRLVDGVYNTLCCIKPISYCQ